MSAIYPIAIGRGCLRFLSSPHSPVGARAVAHPIVIALIEEV